MPHTTLFFHLFVVVFVFKIFCNKFLEREAKNLLGFDFKSLDPHESLQNGDFHFLFLPLQLEALIFLFFLASTCA
jgi:hypothetical protein